MKKKDFVKLVKPIIKECIQEMILEEKLLSNIISETAQALIGERQVVQEEIQPRKQQTKFQQIPKQNSRQRLSNLSKDLYGGVDVFEGTEPLPDEPILEESQGSKTPSISQRFPGMDFNDEGVDLSQLGFKF